MVWREQKPAVTSLGSSVYFIFRAYTVPRGECPGWEEPAGGGATKRPENYSSRHAPGAPRGAFLCGSHSAPLAAGARRLSENHISRHASGAPVTHFRCGGDSAPPAAAAAGARRPLRPQRVTAARQTGAGAGRRRPSEGARGRPGPAPAPPVCPVTFRGPGGGHRPLRRRRRDVCAGGEDLRGQGAAAAHLRVRRRRVAGGGHRGHLGGEAQGALPQARKAGPPPPPPTPAPDASDCGPWLSPRTAPAWGPPPSPQLPGPLLRGWRQRLLPGCPTLPLSDPTPLDARLGPGQRTPVAKRSPGASRLAEPSTYTPASQLTLQLRRELGADRETEAWRVESPTEQGLTTFQQLYLFAVGSRLLGALFLAGAAGLATVPLSWSA
ncbi:ubiquitin-associated domain-containing protein 1 isoform X2 [Macaca fascicularis]|uniref:ubiquitin-associated domain-containing protein 1 isoform X2 n=1 Tax=Macaca fascicularis TaxID=9541 RepID=UPI003D159801